MFKVLQTKNSQQSEPSPKPITNFKQTEFPMNCLDTISTFLPLVPRKKRIPSLKTQFSSLLRHIMADVAIDDFFFKVIKGIAILISLILLFLFYKMPRQTFAFAKTQLRYIKIWLILGLIFFSIIKANANNYFTCDTLTSHQFCGLARNVAYNLPSTLLQGNSDLARAKESLYKTEGVDYKNWKVELKEFHISLCTEFFKHFINLVVRSNLELLPLYVNKLIPDYLQISNEEKYKVV